MHAYHVTPVENLDEIARLGLHPKIGPRSLELGEHAPGIHLFRTAGELEDALGSWLETAFDTEDPLACLLVDIDGLPVDGSGAGYEAILMAPVDARRIRLITRDIWEETGVPDAANATPLEKAEADDPAPC